MASLRRWWRSTLDVREGEHARTVLMGLYFFFILCAVHVLKPVATALFLDRFPARNLTYLYLLIAVVGGFLAYFYTKLAVKTSLQRAVAGATVITVISLALFWRFIDVGSVFLLYAFAIWVNLFGIVFVSQGWLIATNLFDGREAKRLYSIVGLGAILGGAAGGGLTSVAAERAGSTMLLPVGIGLILLAFGSLRAAALAARRSGRFPEEGRRGQPAEEDDQTAADFSIRDVVMAVTRHRHLLAIVGIIMTTYMVEVLVEFQFSVLAKATYSGDELTAFLGRFNGVYLSVVTFVLQLFFTNFAVGRLGVGRTLLVSPISVGVGALSVIAIPGLPTAALTRLFEGSTRYSISRTALELLYLPLPTELKNRTKAFVDVFVDRLGRGFAALLLLALIVLGMEDARHLSFFIGAFAIIWVRLALRARKEYMATVRRRVESRRLDLEGARITVSDTETVKLLEQAARGTNERQVVYAISMLAEAPNYDLAPLLVELSERDSNVIRAKAYDLAAGLKETGLLDRALAEIRSAEPLEEQLAFEAVGYVISTSPDAGALATEFIDNQDCRIAEATLRAISGDRDAVQSLISREWLIAASKSESVEKRALAAYAVGVRGDEGTDALHRLLEDDSPRVIEMACRSAGRLGNRDYLEEVVELLANPRIRAGAIEALISYGESICESLEKTLADPSAAVVIRRQIPRVIASIPTQKSVDALHRSLGEPNLTIRTSVLKGLGRLREAAPNLDYGERKVREQIRSEAQAYFAFHAALKRFRETRPGGPATALLARTIEERLSQTIERLFRLLGLRYPPKQIQAAYAAVNQKRSDEIAAALEFLDNILENDLKNILLPMIDGSPHLLDIGREHFGIEVPSLETAILQQVQTEDTWLTACAIAVAAELRLSALSEPIKRLAESDDSVIAPVAQSAMVALA